MKSSTRSGWVPPARPARRVCPASTTCGVSLQTQLQRAVDPLDGDCMQWPTGQRIHSLVVPRVQLEVAQIMETQTKNPPLAGIAQPDQQIGNLLDLSFQPRAIEIEGLSDPEGTAGYCDARSSGPRHSGQSLGVNPRQMGAFALRALDGRGPVFRGFPAANPLPCSDPTRSASTDGFRPLSPVSG